MPNQAQKHVTVNEGLRMLDAMVQPAALDRSRTAPPEDPTEGDRHVVAGGAQGEWSGQDGRIAAFMDGSWFYFSPRPGWIVYVVEDGRLFAWNGADWIDAVTGLVSVFQNLSLLGIGTTADATNPISVKVNNALWTARAAAEGGTGDLRYIMNKEASGNTLSLLMQSGSQGRAEIGLAGTDSFRFRVSDDGEHWRDAIALNHETGAVQFPNTALPAHVRNLLINPLGMLNQRGYSSGAAVAAAGTYTLDRWRIVNAGQSVSWTTAAGGRTMVAPAGGIEQPIEGASIRAGIHTLSWTGTAGATVNGTPVANGGQIELAGGAQAVVGFYNGSFMQPQLERGELATTFEWRAAQQEEALCLRYFERISGDQANDNVIMIAQAISATACNGHLRYARKRTDPSVYIHGAGSNGFTMASANGSRVFCDSAQLQFNPSPHGCGIRFERIQSLLSSGNAVRIEVRAAGYIDIDAEL